LKDRHTEAQQDEPSDGHRATGYDWPHAFRRSQGQSQGPASLEREREREGDHQVDQIVLAESKRAEGRPQPEQQQQAAG
jgi:hypothetical protein